MLTAEMMSAGYDRHYSSCLMQQQLKLVQDLEPAMVWMVNLIMIVVNHTLYIVVVMTVCYTRDYDTRLGTIQN